MADSMTCEWIERNRNQTDEGSEYETVYVDGGHFQNRFQVSPFVKNQPVHHSRLRPLFRPSLDSGVSRPFLLRTSLSIKSTRSELIDRWRNFHPLVQNSPLPLNTNISRPFYESSQISFGLNILSNPKVPRSFLDQWIDLLDGNLPGLLLLYRRWKLCNSLLNLHLLGDHL